MTTTLVLANALANSGDWEHGWALWPLMWVFWIALVTLGVWLVMRRMRPSEAGGLDSARRILAERYARGEISSEEYRERLEQLR
jgi:putative membrane protein